MEILAILFGVCVLLIYGCFSWGFVAWKFYGWFIVTAIPNAPDFTVTQFIGFSFFLYVILPKVSVDIKSEYKEDATTRIIGAVIAPWIVLIIGALMNSIFF
jgi:hypothetical protein